MEQINAKLDNVLLKLDKYTDTMITRFQTIEGWQGNQDNAIEPELTLGIHKFIRNYATKNGLKYTFKTGRNYPSNLRNPRNARQRITNLDGSYLITNDQRNSKVEDTNSDKPRNGYFVLQDRISKATQQLLKQNSKNENFRDYTPYKNLKQHLGDIEKGVKFVEEEKMYQNNLLTDKNLLENITINVLPNIRELVIVEAKSYVKKEYVVDQASKMMDLINYFSDANFFYQCRRDGKLDTAKKIEKWTPQFMEMCEKYNLNFSGIVLIIGGPSGIKNLHSIFREMKGSFKTILATDIANLSDNTLYIDDYLKYRTLKELEFKLKFKVDFELVLPSGFRFDTS